MMDYEVLIDREQKRFIVKGSFDADAVPVDIPESEPNRKQYIDLFLHKADIERGMDFLRCISTDQNSIVNEGLFIAGLNNCMKCFKHSNSRSKLDKSVVFANNEEMFTRFLEFEKMRDKHFDHDENGMLQATAFLLISPNEERTFGGLPSVVWNRAALNYYVDGQKLQDVMQYILQFIRNEIDKVGSLIEATYSCYSKEQLMSLKSPRIELATKDAKRG